MEQSFTLQELAIALVADNLNPTSINLDFLQYSGIVPKDWALARPPVYTNQFVQLVFKNGLGIVAQPNRLVFLEAVGSKAIAELQVTDLAGRCAKTLSSVHYKAVGINPRGYVAFPGEGNGAQRFLTDELLAAGPWQSFGDKPMSASVQLSYGIADGQLNLSISQGSLQLPESETVPVVVFDGNFELLLDGQTPDAQIGRVQQLLATWAERVHIYQNLVAEKFLQRAKALATAV